MTPKIPYDDEVERAILQRSQHHPADDRIRIKRADLEDIVRDCLYGLRDQMKIVVLDHDVIREAAAEISRRALLSP